MKVRCDKMNITININEVHLNIEKEPCCEHDSLEANPSIELWACASAINYFSNKMQNLIAKDTDELFAVSGSKSK